MRQIETVVRNPQSSDFEANMNLPSKSTTRNQLTALIARWLNRGLPAERIAWDLSAMLLLGPKPHLGLDRFL